LPLAHLSTQAHLDHATTPSRLKGNAGNGAASYPALSAKRFVLRLDFFPMPGNYIVELDHELVTSAGSLFVIEIGDVLHFALHPCHAPLVADKTIPDASIECDSVKKTVPFELRCGVAYLSVAAPAPGPYNVTITLPVEAGGAASCICATFTVLVQPTLHSSDRKSLKHMMLHTQVTRLLGALDSWSPAFEAISAGGYNSVYLTPVQRISPVSGSAFCVADQLQLGLSLFDGSEAASTHVDAFDKLRGVIESCSAKLNLTFVSDVVLNHMALDSPFLLQHPECAYNLNNSPHLGAAALLDAELHSFSHRVLDGEFVSSGLVPVVMGASVVFNLDNELEITKFVDVFFTQVFILKHNCHVHALTTLPRSFPRFL
jgi:hypothetical protein